MSSMMKFLIILLSLVCISNVAADRRKLPSKTKEQMLEVLKKHEGLHMAFFNYDQAKIKEQASILSAQVRKVGVSQVKKYLTKMYKELDDLQAATNKKDSYKLYDSISQKFVKIVSIFNTGKDYNIYSCPMVKKKWIQNTTKLRRVHNPFAPEMPHCGQRDTDYK